jgi:hypothetical protein
MVASPNVHCSLIARTRCCADASMSCWPSSSALGPASLVACRITVTKAVVNSAAHTLKTTSTTVNCAITRAFLILRHVSDLGIREGNHRDRQETDAIDADEESSCQLTLAPEVEVVIEAGGGSNNQRDTEQGSDPRAFGPLGPSTSRARSSGSLSVVDGFGRVGRRPREAWYRDSQRTKNDEEDCKCANRSFPV